MSTDQLIYKGPALGVAVLVLALVLLKFCRIKRRSAAFVSGDQNRPTTVFLHNERTDRKQSLSRHLIHYYISILSLVISFFADRNQSTNECPGEPRRNSLLPASLTNSHPDSAIYSNVSGFPKSQDQPDELGVALIKDTHPVMYSTIDDQN